MRTPTVRTSEEPTLHGPARHGLDRLNSAVPGAAEAALLACCGSRRWARQLVAGRPYPDLAALLRAADRAAHVLAPADLAEALADERGPYPALVRRAGPGISAGSAALAALTRGQAAYEHRFGHVFVLCLDGCRPAEALDRALAALRSRLEGTVEEEAAATAVELARLARGRLIRLAPDIPCTRSHDTRQHHGT
ncbi:2-oxo-4-hydroxy-4-carboxy-5-ureidoimidazoline decarboxylase [Streptomyces sp. NPDC020667]|uniref:2-oxo-4-hydroxy-4-carboxy-5-ureidoimidazoline decarboxylase n=1 Tax=Streptomyces sp. NPDC020667 TaxID=3154895 RepID=UPI0033E63B25